MPLTDRDIATFRTQLLGEFPTADEVFISYGIAQKVIISILGATWWRDNISSSSGSSMNAQYFQPSQGEEGAYLHQHRVIELGRLLYELQDVAFFDDMVADLRTRSLDGAVTELRVLRLLRMAGWSVALRRPTGARGEDYDLDVRHSNGQLIAVEVKSRDDVHAYSRTSVHGTFKQARQQLPKNGPGVVVLRIPTHWARDASFVKEADGLFAEVLRNSKRINAVVVLWDEWLQLVPRGRAVATRFRTFLNASPSTRVAGLQDLLAVISPGQVVVPTRLPFLD
jgi:hypothetical protein